MKALMISLTLIIGSACYSQSTSLTFDYDTAGNQVKRELICVNCDTPAASRPGTSKTPSEEDLVQSIEYSQVSYYPNPVQEELYITWENNKERHVANVELYSITGQLLFSESMSAENNTTTMAFSEMAEGIYSVVLLYNDGERKSLRVIKK